METPNQTGAALPQQADGRTRDRDGRRRQREQRGGRSHLPGRRVWSSGQVIVAVQVIPGSTATTWMITGSTPVTLCVGAAATVLLGLAFFLHR